MRSGFRPLNPLGGKWSADMWQPTMTAAQKHFGIALLLLSCAAAQNPTPFTVRKVTTSRQGSDLRIEITISGPVKPELDTAINPNRILLDLPNTICFNNTKNVAVHANGVLQVRTAQHSTKPYVTRVVLDLDEVRPYAVTAEGNSIILTVTGEHKQVSLGAPVAATSGNVLAGIFRRHRDGTAPVIGDNSSDSAASQAAPPPAVAGRQFQPPANHLSAASLPPPPPAVAQPPTAAADRSTSTPPATAAEDQIAPKPDAAVIASSPAPTALTVTKPAEKPVEVAAVPAPHQPQPATTLPTVATAQPTSPPNAAEAESAARIPIEKPTEAVATPTATVGTAVDNSISPVQPSESPTTSSEDSDETNPAMAVEPAWVTSWDSEGNRRQRIKLGTDFAAGDQVRLGLSFAEGFFYDTLPQSKGLTESIRDAGITGRWRPSDAVKVDGMVGVSETGSSTTNNGQQVKGFLTPITNVLAQLKFGKAVKVDLGFNRSIFDLSPQLVANRVVKNEFVVHPEIKLSSGWRVRELAQLGPMTSPGESNKRYNSEFTIGHKLGKGSELYSTCSILHYAKSSVAGYNPPDLAENLEGGWSTDLDRGPISLSLEFGVGGGHAKQHGDSYGPWGPSGHADADLTWTIRPGRELRAVFDYSYDKSNPALQSLSTSAWQMAVLTLSFHWKAVQ